MKKTSPGLKNWLRLARAQERERRERKRAERPYRKWLARRQAETDRFYRREGAAFRCGWEIALWEVVVLANGRELPTWAADALVAYAWRTAPTLQRKGVMGRKALYQQTQLQMEVNVGTYALMEHYIKDLGFTEAKARRRIHVETHLSDGAIRKRYANAKQALQSGDYYYSCLFDRND